MTNYIVLKQNAPNSPGQITNGAGAWLKVGGGPIEAVSAEAAIRKAVDDKGGTYVAVPMRSWTPLTVKVETTRKLTLA